MNYQKELDELTNRISSELIRPKLLIHSCCAPCSSYVLEYLSQYFEITVLYYNPNIYPQEEYERRLEEQLRFIGEFPLRTQIRFVSGEYQPESFFQIVRGLEAEPEGGKRCFICYELRLKEAAKQAAEGHFDYYTTTLSISPYKNADKLNELGERLAKEYGVLWLPSDFKKKNGYQRSIALSKEYGLYRQDYCGCVFSKHERDKLKKADQ